MAGKDEFLELVACIERDGMVMRNIEVAKEEIVYLKGIIEAYPGIAAIHAPPGATGGPRAQLLVAAPAGFASEIDDILAELADEVFMKMRPARDEC